MTMEIYRKFAMPPKDALKPICAGRLKGKSDIAPQWRIEALTALFGLCGIGWYPKITNRWVEDGACGEKTAHVEIELFVKLGEKWSMPISATGGSMLVTKEKAGLYTSDEAYKMAYTDALSVACKMIGIASDVYRGRLEDSKYSKPEESKKSSSAATRSINADVKLDKVQEKYNDWISYLTRKEWTPAIERPFNDFISKNQKLIPEDKLEELLTLYDKKRPKIEDEIPEFETPKE